MADTRTAKEQLVDALVDEVRDQFHLVLDDEGIIATFVDERVRSLVDRGDLIPRARLAIGTDLEMAPLGLTAACRQLLAAARAKQPDEASGVMARIERILDGLDELDEAFDADEADDLDADEPVDEPHDRNRRTCTVCEEEVTTKQAAISYARWQVVLCADHHTKGWPPTQGEDDGT